MKRYVDQAIVLARTNYGEYDRVITLLTCGSGRMTTFAKGIRAQKSKLAAGVELLSISEVTLLDSKSELKTLAGARLIKHYGNIVKDLNRVNLAFSGLKTVKKITEHTDGQEYFGILQALLAALDDEKYDPQIIEAWFNIAVLKSSGMLPRTDIDEDVEDDELFAFNYDEQRFYASNTGLFDINTLKLVRLLAIQNKPVVLDKPIGSEDQLVNLTRLLLKTNLTEV